MTTNEAGCTCGFPDCMKLTSDRATIRNGWDDDDPDVTRIVRRVGAALNSGRDAAVVAVVLDEVAKAAIDAETFEADRDARMAENAEMRAIIARVEALAGWFESQPNWRDWGIHRQIRAAVDGAP